MIRNYEQWYSERRKREVRNEWLGAIALAIVLATLILMLEHYLK